MPVCLPNAGTAMLAGGNAATRRKTAKRNATAYLAQAFILHLAVLLSGPRQASSIEIDKSMGK
jgi:hypothetical protein